MQEREELLSQLESRPDTMWKTGTIWSFRNEAKIYGSPMFDSAMAAVCGDAADPLPQVISALRAAPAPFVSAPAQSTAEADEPAALTPTKEAAAAHNLDSSGSLAMRTAVPLPEQATQLL